MSTSANPGAHEQAWTIRRCLTVFNAITTRPHWPREPKIQNMLKVLSIKLPEKHTVEEETDDDVEETPESEEPTDDEEVEVDKETLSTGYLVEQT